jgi:plastocyanin
MRWRWLIQISRSSRNSQEKKMKQRNSKLLVCALSAILAIAGFTTLSVKRVKAAGQPSGTEIKIDNFTFEPATITVAAGTQVTWVNRDDMPHTVTSDDKSFKSKAFDTDEKFSFTFSTPGTYKYFCSIHPKMTGEVVVK